MDKIIKEFDGESKLDAALGLGAAGFKVFPVDKRKRPLIKGWPGKATTDPKQIKKWFERPNSPNIGVVTGHQSGPHGLLCLDVDGPEGLASLEELEGQYGKLEYVCVAETPSGGLHIFFQMPPNLDIRNSAGKLGGAWMFVATAVMWWWFPARFITARINWPHMNGKQK